MTGRQSFHAVSKKKNKPECPAEVKAETQPRPAQQSDFHALPPGLLSTDLTA